LYLPCSQTLILTPLQYAGKDTPNLEARIDANIMSLVRLVDSYSRADKPLDMARKAQYLTMDVITDLAFDAPFGYLTTDSDVHGYIQMNEEMLWTVMMFCLYPWVLRVFELPFLKKVMPSMTDNAGFGRVMG